MIDKAAEEITKAFFDKAEQASFKLIKLAIPKATIPKTTEEAVELLHKLSSKGYSFNKYDLAGENYSSLIVIYDASIRYPLRGVLISIEVFASSAVITEKELTSDEVIDIIGVED